MEPEQISNSLAKIIPKQQELVNYLTALKTTLEPEEQAIIEVKYQGKRFGKMEWPELHSWTKALLLKINVITGWVIPEDTLEILVDQFRKKLTESYPNCNPGEVEYAFRNYGTGVKDWGKQMNLSLIDEVMIPYLNRRLELSRIEEQKAPPIMQIENKEDMSRDAMIDWFNNVSKQIKAGEITVDFVPLMLYEFMDDNGNITATNEQKYEYVARATDYRLGQLQDDVLKSDNHNNRWRLSTFMGMKNRGYFEGEELDKVKALAKKMLLYDTIINQTT